jgi:hypothetical protein
MRTLLLIHTFERTVMPSARVKHFRPAAQRAR